jgi:hypothetical protein
MVYLVEERLPYLSFIKILNKHGVVTQNVQPSPELLQMLSLNFISAPLSGSNEWPAAEQSQLESLSRDLWRLVTSFTIRQKQFKDYLNTTMPLTSVSKIGMPFGILSKFIFIIEFTFNRDLTYDESDTDYSSFLSSSSPTATNRINVYNVAVEANNLDQLYTAIRHEWVSMCKMYGVMLEIRRAWHKYPELEQKFRVKKLDYKRLVLKYGPSLAYTLQIRWSKELRSYDVVLGVDSIKGAVARVDDPFVNYHQLFMYEIKRYFAATSFSAVNLAQVLSYTCVSTFAVAKMSNSPKFYSRISNQHVLALPGFMLTICSLTHLRIMYYSRYCLDVHIKPNGLVSIRDGSFALTDIKMAIDDLHPIPFLNVRNLLIIKGGQGSIRKSTFFLDFGLYG